MLIYRLANAEGRGAYYRGAARAWSCNRDVWDDNGRHPGPNDDELLRPHWFRLNAAHGDVLFGFATKTQMRRWVRHADQRRALMGMGYRLYVFEVPDEFAGRGRCQAIFVKAKAKLLRIEEIN